MKPPRSSRRWPPEGLLQRAGEAGSAQATGLAHADCAAAVALVRVGRWRPAWPGQPVQVRVAAAFGARLAGLLALPRLQAGQALLLAPCNGVHTAFMRQAIDVVYLGRDGRVRKVVPQLAPWRASLCLGAAQALELAAGQAAALGLHEGRRIAWEAGP